MENTTEQLGTLAALKILKELENINVDLTPVTSQLLLIDDRISQIPTTDLSQVNTKLDNIAAALQNSNQSPQWSSFTQRSIDIETSAPSLRIDRPIGIGYFYAIQCDRSCRVRGYASNEFLQNDVGRSTNVRPMNSQSCLFDLLVSKVGSALMTFFLSPVAIFAGERLFLNIENSTNQSLFLSLKYVG